MRKRYPTRIAKKTEQKQKQKTEQKTEQKQKQKTEQKTEQKQKQKQKTEQKQKQKTEQNQKKKNVTLGDASFILSLYPVFFTHYIVSIRSFSCITIIHTNRTIL